LQINASTGGPGSRRTGGIRFTNVTIPPSAIINSATLQCYIASASYLTIDATIYGADEKNPATFSGASNDCIRTLAGGDRTYTGSASSALWSHTYSGAGWDTEAKPDVTAIIQTIINRSDWASGDALCLFIEGNPSSTTECRLRAYDYTGNTYGAKLDIDYTPLQIAKHYEEYRDPQRDGRVAANRFLARAEMFGLPGHLRVPVETVVTFREAGPDTYEVRWTSTETAGPFYVWVNGELHSVTNNHSLVLTHDRTSPLFVEVLTRSTDLPSRYFSDTVEFSWQRVDGAAHYRVEEYVSGTWTPRQDVQDLGQEYFFYRTRSLPDDTDNDYQWRVIAVDAEGTESAAATITGPMVRRPNSIMDPDNFSYDNATRKVTITA
jgi:hypothetical protein